MSTHEKIERTDAENVARARAELSRLCKGIWAGERPWHWEIPANPERDTDLIIGEGLAVAERLLREQKS